MSVLVPRPIYFGGISFFFFPPKGALGYEAEVELILGGCANLFAVFCILAYPYVQLYTLYILRTQV